jgi:hypothetical protein
MGFSAAAETSRAWTASTTGLSMGREAGAGGRHRLMHHLLNSAAHQGLVGAEWTLGGWTSASQIQAAKSTAAGAVATLTASAGGGVDLAAGSTIASVGSAALKDTARAGGQAATTAASYSGDVKTDARISQLPTANCQLPKSRRQLQADVEAAQRYTYL